MVDVMSYGGDGGNQDPDRDGRRLSPPCKSAPPSKRRGISRTMNVQRRFKAKLYKNYKSKTHKQYKRRGKSRMLKVERRFKSASQRNTTNQVRIPYHSLQGSKSIMATCHVNRNPQTQEWDSILDTWKSTYTQQTDKGEVWVSEQAERQYYVMVQARETQKQQASSSGTQFDEHNVIQEVLKEKQGHIRGVGRTVPDISHSASSTETSPATGLSARIAELEQIVETHATQIAENATQMAEIQSQLARVNLLMAQIFPGQILGSYSTPTSGVGPSVWVDEDDEDSDSEYYESDDDDDLDM